MNENQVKITPFPTRGYAPLVEYENWRLAVLKFCEDLLPENIKTMQRHLETDEAFVLISGSCMLFLAGNGEQPGKIESIQMQPGHVYNIKKGVWHNHIMDMTGEVLIVENSNTSDDNSPIMELSTEQAEYVRKLSKHMKTK